MLLRRRSDKSDVLKKVPLCSGLSRRYLDLIAAEADEVKEEAGTVLTKQGGLGVEFLLLLGGHARVGRALTRTQPPGPGLQKNLLVTLCARRRAADVRLAAIN